MENFKNKPIALVVEDEESLLGAASDFLESEDFKVVKSRIADQAWQYLKDVGTVDLIWLDHYLLGDDGVALAQKIKAEGAFKDIPIFVISNSEDEDIKKQYLDLGIVKYYTKSDNSLETIVREIKEYLRHN